uniref:Similar to methionyl-tRNA formyltransferase n=1 Tax=Kuenenia stuttgartiensis TaxID=174633 RepID=Q1PVV8_KUEST|nr:similar to methionyl-tRNA formyltransferase [Candidatus Kuenenia stuttgartiensis]
MIKKKIVVFGCQQIGVDFIDFLLTREDIEISLVVTYELPMDKTYGYKSVLEEATKRGLKVINPNRITESLIQEIKEINPYVIFSIYYRKIFHRELLKIPEIGCINIHPSLLPEYRGPVPTAWALMNGEKFFGITIHHMDEGTDTGDILVQEQYEIFDNETGYELYTRTMKLGAEMLKRNFYKILNKEIKPYKQSGIGSYYGKKLGKYTIDWQDKAEYIRNMIRVHAKPYNPAEALLLNRYVIINKATIIRDEKYVLQGAGKIVDILEDKKLIVSCVDGFLRLNEYEIFPKLTEIEEEIYLKIGNKFD